MIYGLNGLRHDGIVSSDNDNRNIRHLGTTRTHGGERFVPRGIEESDVLPVLQFHIVGTNVLRNTTGLTRNDIRIADMVEQRGFTVVDVSHDSDNRAARFDILLVQLLVRIKLLYDVGADIFSRETKFLGHDIDGLSVEALIDTDHKAERHTSTYDFGNGNVHHHSQIVRGNELG